MRSPINSLAERAAVIGACRYVDEVLEDVPSVTMEAFTKELTAVYGVTKLAGIDYSETLIEVAKFSAQSANLHVGTICDLGQWANESFDAVTCFSVYFCLSAVAVAELAFREACRVCRKGGSVFVGDISDLDKKELAMELRGESHKDQPKLSSNIPDHLYLPKSLFWDSGAEPGMENNVRVVDHDTTELAKFYDTAPYRFSVYVDKPPA